MRLLTSSTLARTTIVLGLLVLATVFFPAAAPAADSAPAVAPAADSMPADAPQQPYNLPFWEWVIALLAVSFVMGVLAVLAGVGGGVLYVPVVGSFFPFHLDFVRCAGLLVALGGSVAAGPGLLRAGLANLRLAMPLALIASASSVAGALLSFSLPTHVIQTALGLAILAIAAVMGLARQSAYPRIDKPDRLSQLLQIHGLYQEGSTGQTVNWHIHRTPQGLLLFVFIGVMAGMFGLGAGWANVPALNLFLGAPLKLSVATSKFLISVTDSSAAWVYVNQGATLPIIVVPSILGIMLGSMVGVRLLRRMNPTGIRWIVLLVLLFAGAQALRKGLLTWP